MSSERNIFFCGCCFQVVQEAFLCLVSHGLDVCGLRLLFPVDSTTEPKNSKATTVTANFQEQKPDQGVTPLLAVAVRGPNARTRLVTIVGPVDYTLACRTDPSSLTAKFGNMRDGLPIFYPRNEDRANSELVRWFGGRVPESGSMAVGVPYKMNDELVPNYACSKALLTSPQGRGKKGRQWKGMDSICCSKNNSKS